MGVSFTFVTVLSTIAVNYGYPAVIGVVLIGGIFEGTLGLLAKYWRKIISPIVAICMGKVDLSIIFSDGFIALPKLLPYKPEFNLGAIFSVCIIYLVSAAETIGDTTAMVASGLN